MMLLSRSVAVALSIGFLAGCSKSGGEAVANDAGASAPSASTTTRLPIPDGGVLNTTPVPTASVAAMLNPGKLPAYTGPTGSVEGTITVTGDAPPAVEADFSRCPNAKATWGTAFREGPPNADGKRALADAIVVATGYQGFYIPETQESKEVTIEGCAYTSRTVTLTYGQRLDVKNLAKEFWTPILEPDPNLVMRMAAPKGDPVPLYPKKPGHWLLMDRDRKYAVVDVYAFLHPLHASTDVKGHYRIDGLPVGKLKIGVTHPQLGAATESELDVKENVVHRLDLTLNYVRTDASAPTLPEERPRLH